MSFDKGRYSMMGLPSRQVAQRDQSSHSRLKLRRVRAGGDEETAEEKLKRLKRELEAREQKQIGDSSVSASTIEATPTSTAGNDEAMYQNEKKSSQADHDADADADADADVHDKPESSEDEAGGKPAAKPSVADLALQKELERVKLERQLKAQQEAAMKGLTSNPLLESSTLQRRWDDDVIFRNQAKPESEKRERRLVNDIVHSDTHKNFLKKHIL